MKDECLKWVGKKKRREKREAFFFFPKCWCLQQDIKFLQDTNDEQLGQFLCPSGAYIVFTKKEVVLWQNTLPLYFTRRNRKGENKTLKCSLGTASLLHELQLPTQSILTQMTAGSNHTCGKQFQNTGNEKHKFKTSKWTFA